MRNWNRKTSSSKLSSVSTSFSTAAKGNFNHNRRTNSKVPQNVDPTKTAFNSSICLFNSLKCSIAYLFLALFSSILSLSYFISITEIY